MNPYFKFSTLHFPSDQPRHAPARRASGPRARHAELRETALLHTTKAIPPFKINVPLEQWEQLVQIIAASQPGTPLCEAYLGFNEQLLALHRIDAVPVE